MMQSGYDFKGSCTLYCYCNNIKAKDGGGLDQRESSGGGKYVLKV